MNDTLTFNLSKASFFTLALSMFLSSGVNAQIIEKSYLSTDKDIYAPEDTIWFKGYVFNHNNWLSDQSIAYHVFLVDSQGNKFVDTSWPVNGGVTDGYFVAPRFEGSYKLIAISGQMIGAPSEQAFSRNIFVRSELADEIEILAFPQFQNFDPKTDNLIDVFTQHSSTKLAPDIRLTYQVLSNGEEIQKGRLRTSEKGKAILKLPKIKNPGKNLQVLIQSNDKVLSRPVKLTVPIVVDGPIALQFFPEGGELISNISNRIAFKALSNTGEPKDIKGVLFKDGLAVDTIKSFYQGMGSFELAPDGSDYRVRIIEPTLSDSIYAIPKAIESGIALKVYQTDSSKTVIHFNPHKNSNKAGYHINVRQRGQLVLESGNPISGEQHFYLPTDKLWPGIAVLTILDTDNVPIVERLIFVKRDHNLKVSVETNKLQYDAREKVETLITVRDQEGNPVQGNFSFSVIDLDRSQSPLGTQPHLISEILLNSELRGEVPTPSFYFTDHPKAEEALDLVLLTNGWRRYLPSVIADPEAISGSLLKTNRKRKKLSDREIQLVALKNSHLESFYVDTSGVFRISSTYLKNHGDSFLIFSNKLNKKDKFSIVKDEQDRQSKVDALYTTLLEQPFPASQHHLIHTRLHKLKPDRFQNTLLLNSVTVEGQGNSEDGDCVLKDYHFEDPWSTKLADELDMSETHIISLIRQVNPNIRRPKLHRTLFRDAVFIEHHAVRGDIPTRLHINCQPVPVVEPVATLLQLVEGDYKFTSTINRIDLSNLESISVNTEYIPHPGFPPDFKDWVFPIININTINDVVIYKPIFNTKIYHASFKNYTKEFYAPVYETEKQKKDPVPDLRTTIFWQANVFTDENGQARISFYNADRSNQIGITVEGVDAYSRMGYAQTTYKVLEGPLTEHDNNE